MIFLKVYEHFLVLKHKKIIQESLHSVQADLLFITLNQVLPVQISKCSIKELIAGMNESKALASSQVINKK